MRSKKIRYGEDILDNMGRIGFAANLFRITQTESKIINDKIISKKYKLIAK